MRVNAVALMRFVHELRGEFFETAASLGWEEFTRDQGVSLGSYRNLFVHLAHVEHQHFTYFLQGRAVPWSPVPPEASPRRYRTVESVRERLRAMTELSESYLGKWDSDRELQKVVRWVRLGHPLKVTRETALAQCATEHLLHLGEVEAMLWQHDEHPPTTLWIDRIALDGRPPAPPPTRSMKKAARDPGTLLSKSTRVHARRAS